MSPAGLLTLAMGKICYPEIPASDVAPAVFFKSFRLGYAASAGMARP